jgi:hypothetical protein
MIEVLMRSSMLLEDLFHSVLGCFADFLRTCDALLVSPHSNLGRYEADVAAMSLAILSAKNAWAVHELGTLSPTYRSACAGCARSAFELGAVASWLLVPDDPFEREGRWLGWLKGNERFYRNLSNDLRSVSPEVAEQINQTAIRHFKWRSAIEARLPSRNLIEKPAMPHILAELGFLQLYSAYRVMSQVIHAEPDSTTLAHKVKYEPKDPDTTEDIFEAVSQMHYFGYFTDESSWVVPIRMAVWGLMAATPRLLSRIEAVDRNPDLLFEKQEILHRKLEVLESAREVKSFD